MSKQNQVPSDNISVSSSSIDYSQLNADFQNNLNINDSSNRSRSAVQAPPLQRSQSSGHNVTLLTEKEFVLGLNHQQASKSTRRLVETPEVIEILSDEEEENIINMCFKQSEIKRKIEQAKLTKSRFTLLKTLYMYLELKQIERPKEKERKFNSIVRSYISKKLKTSENQRFDIESSHFIPKRIAPANQQYVPNEYILFGVDLLSHRLLQKIFQAYSPVIKWIDSSHVKLTFAERIQGWSAIVDNVMSFDALVQYVQQTKKRQLQNGIINQKQQSYFLEYMQEEQEGDGQSKQKGSSHQAYQKLMKIKSNFFMMKDYYELNPYFQLQFQRRLMIRNATKSQQLLRVVVPIENQDQEEGSQQSENKNRNKVGSNNGSKAQSEKGLPATIQRINSLENPINLEQSSESENSASIQTATAALAALNTSLGSKKGNRSVENNIILEEKVVATHPQGSQSILTTTPKKISLYKKFVTIREKLFKEIEETPSVKDQYLQALEDIEYQRRIVKYHGKGIRGGIGTGSNNTSTYRKADGRNTYTAEMYGRKREARDNIKNMGVGGVRGKNRQSSYQNKQIPQKKRNYDQNGRHGGRSPNNSNNKYHNNQQHDYRDYHRGNNERQFFQDRNRTRDQQHKKHSVQQEREKSRKNYQNNNNYRREVGEGRESRKGSNRGYQSKKIQYNQWNFGQYLKQRDQTRQMNDMTYHGKQYVDKKLKYKEQPLGKFGQSDEFRNSRYDEQGQPLEDILANLNASTVQKERMQKSIIMGGDGESNQDSNIYDLEFILMDSQKVYIPSQNRQIEYRTDMSSGVEMPQIPKEREFRKKNRH